MAKPAEPSRQIRFPLRWGCALALLAILAAAGPPAAAVEPGDFAANLKALSAWDDRSSGTPGHRAAAEAIRGRFTALGFEDVGVHRFALPLRRHTQSRIALPAQGRRTPLNPINGNAISPGTIAPEGLDGPLVYVGPGDLPNFNGTPTAGAIVLMDLTSGRNWLHAANLGAKALIYVDRGDSPRTLFEEKHELSPIRFPRFWLPLEVAHSLLGDFEGTVGSVLAENVRLTSDLRWEPAVGENIYCLVPGTDPDLKEQLLLVEAFYDSTPLVFGRAPGSDEACGIASLLTLAAELRDHPPARSILLVATDGHATELAGMRELVWSISARTRELRETRSELQRVVKTARQMADLLGQAAVSGFDGQETAGGDLREALAEEIKTEVDRISRELIQLRLDGSDNASRGRINTLAQERQVLRGLLWRSGFAGLNAAERAAAKMLLPEAIRRQEMLLADARHQLELLESANRLRGIVRAHDLAAAVSLHLSSHGDGLGAFNRGWLYPLKPSVNRVAPYSTLNEVLNAGAAAMASAGELPYAFRDTLRPSRVRPWQSHFIDQPHLGGEVSALAGYLGFTLATVNDARTRWGTPGDRPQAVDTVQAARQCALVCGLVQALARAPRLDSGIAPSEGFATVSGHAKRLRHGELFPDQAAPGAVLLAFQGPARHHAIVDARGRFQLKGVAEKRHVLDKVIIEGYRFDPESGETLWAIDKKQTGKEAYRLKMQRRNMETDLVMFSCRQTTIFDLLEPRSFRYLTKIQVLDGRREALPLRYWYSRIDTRSSVIASIFLEPGTRMKLTLSDTVLRNKMLLLNATPDHPEGTGFPVDDYPSIPQTAFHVARDMWTLLTPRIAALETHGIHDERIRQLREEGVSALRQAEADLDGRRFDRAAAAAARSWALASRVYNHVQKTQKDVLFGVLFYIALFVPFAFCLERLLFSYANIHKRIVAFVAILAVLIAVIFQVHPAFQLAYSPLVVVLAFFIMGLSLVVTLIIFFRFENEMVRLQRRASRLPAGEISRWKAFVAAFFLGVNNLRRRRLRTVLTCLTLIILTFTIMSFTSVKTNRQHARMLYQDRAPYPAILMKNVNWQDLPPEALGIITNEFHDSGLVAPRVWLEDADRTRSTRIPLRFGDRRYEAQGMIGLASNEPAVTGLDQVLVGGRWFREDEEKAVLISERMARELGIGTDPPAGTQVLLWGLPFEIAGVFSGERLQGRPDLDGEILTPVTFPSDIAVELTEVEMDALESGDEVLELQGAYQHIPADLTVIVPADTLLALGGRLKAAALRPDASEDLQALSAQLADRFGLTLFSGEPDGTFIYHASETIRYSGVPNILIPLVISVFIVLNTMIGSVYERKREIGIYTSVGLAPSHVGFLFVAEAMAFAVLSVVLGYLLAQSSAKLFAGTTLWAGITVNYSSLAGVAAMLLVILVVLVSVIYPARVAAEIAIPDVNRSWRLPDAQSSTIEITLPFLMKYHEHLSIGGFVIDHFRGHQDVSHGLFSSGEIDFGFEDQPSAPDGATCLFLRAKVWLAPFDFGIMQTVTVTFCPSQDKPDLYEIRLRLVRQTGEANVWGRVNRVFVNDLRKQLLVWRSLPAETQEFYRGRLETAGPAPTV
ncbi:MAG: peptide ABC transporter permease [Desulfobacteraceae bacterium]|nr:peptide ABC transporter permease [Desulfobacteraceae bacterium]